MRDVLGFVLIWALAGMVGSSYSSDSLSVVVTLRGEASNEHFGGAMAGAGDVNGDGLADLIVGDARGGWSHTGERRCYLYYGNNSPQTIPDVVIHQPELDTLYYPSGNDDRFGETVAGGCDLNGDGYDDIVITSPEWDFATGKIYAYHGASLMDVEPDVGLAGVGSSWMTMEWATRLRGRVVEDINGDGCDELVCLVGNMGVDAGAYVYFGGAPMDSVHDLGFQGPGHPILDLGSDIAFGDVNGDGFVDLAVGCYQGELEETAWIYLGGEAMDTTPDIKLGTPGYVPVASVCIPGDLNNDGFDDVAVVFYPHGDRSVVAVFFGGSRMDSVPDLYLDDGFPTGHPMRLAGGDLNLDGYPDLIVSKQLPSSDDGVVAVYLGGAEMDSVPDFELSGSGSFGEELAWIGDMTGDGYPEFAVSSPDGDGEIYIYTMGEVSAGQGPVPFPKTMKLHVVPNPTRGPTTIGFMTKEAGRAIANIYDLGGHLVRRIESREQGRGWQQVLWDGNNRSGKAVPAGTYIVRVEIREQTMIENLVVSP